MFLMSLFVCVCVCVCRWWKMKVTMRHFCHLHLGLTIEHFIG